MEQLLTAREVAETLRISLSTVRAWRFQGRLAAVKLGKGIRSRVVYRQADVDKLIQDSFQPARN